jgi:hypothetical protein
VFGKALAICLEIYHLKKPSSSFMKKLLGTLFFKELFDRVFNVNFRKRQ